MVPPLSRIAGVLAAAVVGLSLAACQGDDAASPAASSPPSSSSSVTPSGSPIPSDPAESVIEERAADAEHRYREFLEIRNEYAQKGKNPFEELLNNGYLGNSDAQKVEQSLWEDYTDLNLKQVGAMKVVSVEMTDYEGDPLKDEITGQRVHFEVCTDSSDYDVVRPNGETAVRAGPSRKVRQVVMQGQPTGTWSVVGYASAEGKC